MKTPSQSEFETELLLLNEQEEALPVAEQLARMRRAVRLMGHRVEAVLRTLESIAELLRRDCEQSREAAELHRKVVRAERADRAANPA